MTELTRDDSAPVNWARLQPLIDDALGQLRPAEREAILLRYFQGHTYAEIGSRLGMTENATRSAVDRGVDKLGGILARRGIASTSTAVAAALAGQVAMAAPADVAASVTAGALASAAAAGSASGAAAVFMSMTKLQLGIAVAIVGAGTAGFVVQQRHVAAMRTAFADLDRQMQQSAAISAENLQLEQARQAAATQTAASKAELANLRRQTADLRTQLQELQLKRAIPAVAPTTQVGTPSATVYPESAVDVQPKPTFRPPPIYPSDLRGLGINGKVTVAFTIATDGRVTDVVTKDATYPAFADSVKEALGHWRFQPGQKDGHAVATRVDMPITFKMVNNATPASTKSPTQAGGVPWF